MLCSDSWCDDVFSLCWVMYWLGKVVGLFVWHFVVSVPTTWCLIPIQSMRTLWSCKAQCKHQLHSTVWTVRKSAPARPIHIIAWRLGSVNIALLNYSHRRGAILVDGTMLHWSGSPPPQAHWHIWSAGREAGICWLCSEVWLGPV